MAKKLIAAIIVLVTIIIFAACKNIDIDTEENRKDASSWSMEDYEFEEEVYEPPEESGITRRKVQRDNSSEPVPSEDKRITTSKAPPRSNSSKPAASKPSNKSTVSKVPKPKDTTTSSEKSIEIEKLFPNGMPLYSGVPIPAERIITRKVPPRSKKTTSNLPSSSGGRYTTSAVSIGEREKEIPTSSSGRYTTSKAPQQDKEQESQLPVSSEKTASSKAPEIPSSALNENKSPTSSETVI